MFYLQSTFLGERWQFVKVPSKWEDSGSISTQMGVTGYIFSGGTAYDHRAGDQDDAPLAIFFEGESLDPYNGHSDQHSQYHYHAVSFTSLYTVMSKYSMAEKKYWKISCGVMVIPSESIEFTHEGRRPE